VVSTRLRPWVDLDLGLSEVVLTEQEAVLSFRLTLANGGMASARGLVVEALALNAGDTQSSELATFYARPDGEQVGVAELPRLGSSDLTHDVRMPRAAIREYVMQGRRLFVPIIAFNVGYRWSGGTGRTSAAFLVGFEQPGSDRLAPLGLDEGPRRLAGLGVRRLEDQVRR
jgi:hypothetical protein